MATLEEVHRLVRRHLQAPQPYEAKDALEDMAEKAGIPRDRIVKLNGNENPYGCSPRVKAALASFDGHHLYPDHEQTAMRQMLSEYVGLGPEHILVGNGSDELIDLLVRLFLEPEDAIIECDPTFGMYRFSAAVCGGRVVSVPRDGAFNIDVEGVLSAARDAKMVFITSPNNPTGSSTPKENVRRILERGPVVVVDETYHEFSGYTVTPWVPEYPNLVVLRTMSKWAGLAGLRIGYGIMPPWVVQHLMAIKPPYNVSQMAEVALRASLEDREELMSRVRAIVQERERMARLLRELEGVNPWPSEANFLLCQVPQGRGQEVVQGLARHGVFVRYFSHPRLHDAFRATVGLSQDTDALVQALRQVL